MYLVVVFTIEFATFHNASANASAANPERSQRTRGTPSPTQPQKTNTQVMDHWHYAEIYDFGLVEQNASVSPLVYLLSSVELMMVCLSLFDFFRGWLHWR